MKGLNIAIAGCGPCGLAAALLLLRGGHAVTLFERFETAQPVGSGLMIQPIGLTVLDRLGLAERIIAEGARIERLFGMAGKRVVLDVRYSALRGGGFGIGIHRASLFETLFAAIREAGIEVLGGRTVVGSDLIEDKRWLRLSEGGAVGPFDLLVDTLGARSLLSAPGRELAYGALWATLLWPAQAGFDACALSQRYRRSSTMAGVLPVGQGNDGVAKAAFFWSLRGADLDAWRMGGLPQWKAAVLKLWPECAPLLDQIGDPAQLTFAHYAHRTLRDPTAPALIHLGDAWHSTSPQLGQGANMALLDAWALAHALRESRTVPGALAETVRLRRHHVELYQGLSRLFTPVYQSDSRILPWVRDRVVGPLSKLWPATVIQAAMVSGLIGQPLEPLGLGDHRM